MKERILKLRKEGKSYSQIVDIIGCSKSTVAYHCNNTVREKHLGRQNKKKAIRILDNKIRKFKNRGIDTKQSFGINDVRQKFGDNPKCYLTGEDVDFNLKDSYHLDHIIPVCKGGNNSLDNMGVTIPAANFAKRDLLVEEFLNLCKNVLTHHGYIIHKDY